MRDKPIRIIPSRRIEIDASFARRVESHPEPWYSEQIVYLAGLCDRVNKTTLGMLEHRLGSESLQRKQVT